MRVYVYKRESVYLFYHDAFYLVYNGFSFWTENSLEKKCHLFTMGGFMRSFRVIAEYRKWAVKDRLYKQAAALLVETL